MTKTGSFSRSGGLQAGIDYVTVSATMYTCTCTCTTTMYMYYYNVHVLLQCTCTCITTMYMYYYNVHVHVLLQCTCITTMYMYMYQKKCFIAQVHRNKLVLHCASLNLLVYDYVFLSQPKRVSMLTDGSLDLTLSSLGGL